MQVSVSSIDGETHEIAVRGADTVRQTKKQLQRLAGTPWTLQHLFMIGLEDELQNELTMLQIKQQLGDSSFGSTVELFLLKDFNR